MPLNSKQKRFAKEYLIDRNATKAALRAGYAKKSAYSQGHDLLKKPEVQDIINSFDRKVEIAVEKKSSDIVFTKAMWLRELKLISLANMDDFVRIEEVELYKDSETGKPVKKTTAQVIATKKRRFKSFGKVIKKISESKHGVAIELQSKQAALDTLGRHYGWVKNEVAIDDKNKPQVIITLPSNGREAKAIIDETPSEIPDEEF